MKPALANQCIFSDDVIEYREARDRVESTLRLALCQPSCDIRHKEASFEARSVFDSYLGHYCVADSGAQLCGNVS